MKRKELTMATYFNSEGERVGIERCTAEPFVGKPLLVIYDDPPPRGTGTQAPMLLDGGTVAWLTEQLAALAADSPREGEG